MGFKKVIVNDTDQCPSCGGKSGLKYHVKMDVPFFIKWDSASIGCELLSSPDHNQPKTSCCIDCGKRVEFEISTKKPCLICKKPRGEDEHGAYVCPCPHCGDKIPF